ncbi:WxL domain-containing protein [Enterococcus faecalis]|uniref:WxL domain-containing protein n=1 Tax=Enterococcus faecalis TaxID=1351 RepID=UPI0035DFFD0A
MRILILSAPKGGTFLKQKNLLTYQSLAALLLVFSLFSFDPSVSFATRSGKTPVSVELEIGGLPGDESVDDAIDPDLENPNTSFDLLFIPKEFTFETQAISGDLTAVPIRPSEGNTHTMRHFGMGDVRGALTGWHVTAEIPHMRNEAHSLLGIITFQLTGGYARYDKMLRRFFMTNTMYGLDFSEDPAAPDFPTNPIIIGNGATLMSNAGDRKGQGMWSGRMTDISLAIQTPVSQLFPGAYTGSIIWNLISGPA